MGMECFSVHMCIDVAALFPGAEFSTFERAPAGGPSERDVLAMARDIIQGFDVSFDMGRWESVNANPFVRDGKVLYYGIYGQTVVAEGQFYVNDVTEGDDMYISPGPSPRFCFHGGVFRTDDRELYEKVKAASADI